MEAQWQAAAITRRLDRRIATAGRAVVD